MTVENPSGNEDKKDLGEAPKTPEQGGDKVAYETYQKVLAERKKDQAKARELEAKLKELSEFKSSVEQERQKIKEQKLEEEGNWKALLEQRDNRLKEYEEKLNEYKSKNQSYEKNINDMIKLSAFDRALGGKLKKDEYYSFVDTDKIVINPETNQVDMDSLKNYANEFQNEHKELIDYKRSKLPTDAPSGSAKLTYDEWLKLPLAEKRKRMKDVMPRKR